MNEKELENWRKVKEALEESGNTKSEYYRRAVAIVSGLPDPLK